MFSRQQVIQPVILDITRSLPIPKDGPTLIKENIEFAVIQDPRLDSRKTQTPGQIEPNNSESGSQCARCFAERGKAVHPDEQCASGMRTPLLLEQVIPPGRFVLLEVTDTGTGMDQWTQAHISSRSLLQKHRARAPDWVWRRSTES